MTSHAVIDPPKRSDEAPPVSRLRRPGSWGDRAIGRVLAGQLERPGRRTMAWTVGVWAATVVVGFALLGPSRWRWGLVGEAVSYLGLGLGLVCWRPFRRLLAALPARGRRLPPAVLVLLLLGQLVGGSRLAFPLSRFSMYTDELSATEVSYAVEAVGAGGERVVVSDPSLFPSWRRDRFASLVERIAEDEVPGDGGCRGFPELARTVAELPEWQGRRPSRVELVATTYDFAHRHAEPPSATARTVVCTATVEP